MTHSTSLHKRKGPTPKLTEVRFWEKVDIRSQDECWEWQAFCNNQTGYGQFMIQETRKPIGAHRMAYMLSTGDVLVKGDMVCHSCDNRRCVNPYHLFKGDAKINTHDMVEKGRIKNRKHPASGFESVQTKLTLEEAKTVKSRYLSGERVSSLAREFGLGRTTISRIVSGKRGYANI